MAAEDEGQWVVDGEDLVPDEDADSEDENDSVSAAAPRVKAGDGAYVVRLRRKTQGESSDTLPEVHIDPKDKPAEIFAKLEARVQALTEDKDWPKWHALRDHQAKVQFESNGKRPAIPYIYECCICACPSSRGASWDFQGCV